MFPNSYFYKKYFKDTYFPPLLEQIISGGWKVIKDFTLFIREVVEVSLER